MRFDEPRRPAEDGTLRMDGAAGGKPVKATPTVEIENSCFDTSKQCVSRRQDQTLIAVWFDPI